MRGLLQGRIPTILEAVVEYHKIWTKLRKVNGVTLFEWEARITAFVSHRLGSKAV